MCVGGVDCLFLRSPGQAPYGARSACAKRAAYPDPPPVVPDPESLAASPGGLYRGSIARAIWLRPELFLGIGVLPGSATGSQIVNRVTRLGLEFNYLGNVK